jgi:hypothetical protein
MGSKPQRNVGRIDHVVFFYSSFEKLQETREKITAVLGLSEDDWEDPANLDPPFNLCTQLCWRAGLEIACPTPGYEDNWFGAPLIAERGEGLGIVVFGVANLDAAAEQAARAGLPVVQTLEDSRYPPGESNFTAGVPFAFGPGVEAPFRLIREAVVTPFNSTGLAIGQLEPLD